VIGFLNTSYTVAETEGVASIQIGAISSQGVINIQRPVLVEISTGDISAVGELFNI
jgi:hypothetical protein